MHIIIQGLKQYIQESYYSYASHQNHYLAHTQIRTLNFFFLLLSISSFKIPSTPNSS